MSKVPYSQQSFHQQKKTREANQMRRVDKFVDMQRQAWAAKFAADPSIGEFSPFKNYK